MKQYYETLGHEVTIYTSENLCINDNLFQHDFFILKSKKLVYLYAGCFLKENHIPIYPDPHLTMKHKYRIDAHFLIKKAGLLYPQFFIGSKEALNKLLKNDDFPLISKSLMDSGSKNVKVIRSFEDLNSLNDDVVYYEHYIDGIHHIIYFIGNEISVAKKPPLSNEHAKMEQVTPTKKMKEIINKWQDGHNIKFGHLDVIKETSSGRIFIVDPGNFPEFTNWKENDDPCPKICNIILDEIKNMRG